MRDDAVAAPSAGIDPDEGAALFSSLVMPGLDPGIHRKKRFIEEDGLPRHKRVHARLPTHYARQ
jgi:hypothetical protein